MDSSFTQTNIRMLAAIMFTDMVGYTSLMQSDESLAVELRDRQREILQNKITEYQGRILQYYGDGTLSIFGSAVQAVKASIEIQQTLNIEPKVPLRIGIHIGDIATDNAGVYGDGVNVASRIQALGIPGSVLISAKVFDELKNHPEYKASFLGSFNLKNVKDETTIYAVSNEGLLIPAKSDMESQSAQTYKSIAVLPFVNMSADPENEYFSDGISEEILNALAQVKGLRVTSRTSSFAFKGRNEDIREIGDQLNVTTILEGSVRKHKDKVRVTAQLIDVQDGYHVWSETFDRDLQDIFEVQDEISNKIVDTLKDKLTLAEEHVQLISKQTENMDAYNAYLKGNFFWNRQTPNSIKKAVEFFRMAIEIEPTFSLPYSKLSGSYAFLGAIGAMQPSEAYPLAKNYAEKALNMDNNCPDAHLAMAMLLMFYEWDWAKSRQHFDKALELSSSSATVLLYNAYYYTMRGNRAQAIEFAEAAYMVDPLSTFICNGLAGTYLSARRPKDAIKYYKKALQIDPEFRGSLYGLGWAYYIDEQIDEALEVLKKAHSLTKEPTKGLTQLGYIYGKSGETEKALNILAKMEQREKENPDEVLDIDFAVIYVGLKEYDKAFKRLDRAYEKRMGGILFIRSPLWEEIHNDPRYKRILKKLNLI